MKNEIISHWLFIWSLICPHGRWFFFIKIYFVVWLPVNWLFGSHFYNPLISSSVWNCSCFLWKLCFLESKILMHLRISKITTTTKKKNLRADTAFPIVSERLSDTDVWSIIKCRDDQSKSVNNTSLMSRLRSNPDCVSDPVWSDALIYDVFSNSQTSEWLLLLT